MFQISRIKMNYMKNPVGITEVPQFGWVMESDRRNTMQTFYQLQIAGDEQFEQVLYDSGKVESEESAHVFVPELKLQSSSCYYVRVKAGNNYGEETSWSETGSFLTGILDCAQWKAEFISAESEGCGNESKGTYVRKAFTVEKPVKAAYAYTTALGVYHFFLNGAKVGKDEMAPGWTSYHNRVLYQTYDITDCLQSGENAAGAMVGPGWYKGTMGFETARNHYGDRTAFFAQIVIQYEDGSEEYVVTDASWQGKDAPVIFSEIYHGEIYDARLEAEGWCEPGMDTKGWSSAEIIDYDKKTLTGQEGCTVRQIETLPVKRVIQTPKGETVLDFGQNMTGWVTFKVKGQAGAKAQLQFFEVLDAQGNVYLENLRSAREQITYICKDEQEAVYRPYFSFQGFQYVQILSWPGEIRAEDFTACVVHSAMEPTGDFSCSNPDINQLQHNILWGMKGNFLDIPTDCPQRDERLGWTGDAQIFCRTATYLMNTYPFFSKWLRDVAADQTEEGGVPFVVPDVLKNMNTDKASEQEEKESTEHSATAWADVAVINPWNLYLAFGDTRIIEQQYESMKGWVEFMRSHSEDGIWKYHVQFGDWVALDAEEGSYHGATPDELICCAYFSYSSRLLAKMAKAVGREEDYREYQALSEEVKDAFVRHFYQKDGRMTAQTQTAHILALHFDLAPAAYKEQTIRRLIELLEKENGHLVTGFVGTPYFCHALSENGHGKEAYELLLKDDFPSWLYQVKMGATTIWEHWDGLKPDGTMWSADMNSFNHYAYGAVGEWLYRVVAGLDIDEEQPGYKCSLIKPLIGGGLTNAEGTYKSVYGTVKNRWELDGGQVVQTVEVPVNTTARILLTQAVEMPEAEGLSFEKAENGYYCNAGSGCYRIKYRIEME